MGASLQAPPSSLRSIGVSIGQRVSECCGKSGSCLRSASGVICHDAVAEESKTSGQCDCVFYHISHTSFGNWLGRYSFRGIRLG